MNRRSSITPPPAAAFPDNPGGFPDNTSRWVDALARSLIQHAARNAPASLSERLEEEWLADFAERRGPMARVRFGIGCCWATTVIAHEYAAPKVLAAATTTGNKVMNAYAQQDYSLFSRRTIAFIGIIGLHVVLIYALATGLTHRFLTPQPDMVASWEPDAPKHTPPPPPFPPPTFSPRVVDIPRVDLDIDVKVDDSRTIRDVIPDVEQHFVPPAPPATLVKRVLGGPGRAFPNTDDFYPADAIRKEQTGAVTVYTCVDEKGRLTAAPTVARSSGTASLDEGALKLAKAGSGHYRATTEDGRPVSSCYEFMVRYNLRK